MNKKLKLSNISVCLLALALFGFIASICLNIAGMQMVNCQNELNEAEMFIIPPSQIPEIQEEELLVEIKEEGVEIQSEEETTAADFESENAEESTVVEGTQPIEDSQEEPGNVEKEEIVQETIPETETVKPVETTPPENIQAEAQAEQVVIDTSNQSYKEIEVVATAYCSCQKCCGQYAINRPKDENGNDIVYTATGNICKPNHTIAVDPDYIPYGTVVEYNDIQWVAEDCGSGVDGYHIDIYYDSHEEALQWGKRVITVKVYNLTSS